MLMWGQRWLEPTASDPHLVHKPCGRALLATLACASCLESVARDDIALS
jgi:hypothetical protein